jgi:hypothetical protein
MKSGSRKNGGHGGSSNSNISKHKQQSIKSGSRENGGRDGGGGNGGGNGNCNGNSSKDNNNGNNDGGGRSGGSSDSGDGGGDGCGGAIGNLPSVNNATIMLMMFPTRPTTLTPPQWPRRDKRRRHVRRGRGWARTEHHLPLSLVAAATDQSKLP